MTKGKWEVVKRDKANHYALKADGWDFAIISFTETMCSLEECKANAKLIAEAGTVANETGFTPRELLKQRDALLTACRELLVMLVWTGSRMSQEPAARKRAEKAIAATK